MSEKAARTDADAINTVRQALQRFESDSRETVSQANSEMSRADSEVELLVTDCRREAARAQQALEFCMRSAVDGEPPDCSSQLRAYEKAKVKFAQAQSLSHELSAGHSRFTAGRHRFESVLSELVTRGSNRMQTARSDVEQFERHQNVNRRGSSRSWRPLSGRGQSSGGPGAGSSGGVAYSSGSGFGGGGGGGVRGPSSGGNGASNERGGVFASQDPIEAAGLPDGMVLVPLAGIEESSPASARRFGQWLFCRRPRLGSRCLLLAGSSAHGARRRSDVTAPRFRCRREPARHSVSGRNV